MHEARDANTPLSATGGPPGSHGAADINAAAEAIKAGHPAPELAEAIRRGYEPHDINLRWLYIFGVVLIVTLVVSLVIVAGVMKGLLAYDRSVDAISSPVNIEHRLDVIPLQPSVEHNQVDRDDMDLMRQHVQMILSGAGQHGDRRWIPIDQAMEQVLPMLPIRVPPAPGNGSRAAGGGVDGASASASASAPGSNVFASER